MRLLNTSLHLICVCNRLLSRLPCIICRSSHFQGGEILWGGEASSLEISRCNSLPFRMTDGHFPPLPCIARENLLIFTVMKTNDQTWQFSSRVNLELSSYKPVDFPQPIFNSGKVSTDTSYPSGSLPPHQSVTAQGIPTTFNIRLSQVNKKMNHQEKPCCIQNTKRNIWGISHSSYYQHHYFETKQCHGSILILSKNLLCISNSEKWVGLFQVFYN